MIPSLETHDARFMAYGGGGPVMRALALVPLVGLADPGDAPHHPLRREIKPCAPFLAIEFSRKSGYEEHRSF